MKKLHPIKSLLVAFIAFSLIMGGLSFGSGNTKSCQSFPNFKKSSLALAENVADQLTALADTDLYFPAQQNWEYENLNPYQIIRLEPGETTEVSLTIKNLGRNPWPADKLKLGTIYSTGDYDRMSAFANESWEGKNRIKTSSAKNWIYRGQRANFTFSLSAPLEKGFYREYFQPLIENVIWIPPQKNKLYLDILVGKKGVDVEIMRSEEKEIIVDRPNQIMKLKENGQIIAQLPVSTGRIGYTTPAGTFRVINHILCTYSHEYKLYMDNWMAIKQENRTYKGYGIHALPYWKLRGGRKLYEDVEHLGTPISHGCIRVGVYESNIVYDWAENGTKITVI